MNLARFFLRIGMFLFVPLIVAFLTYRILNRAMLQPLNPSDKQIVLIELSAGRTIKDIADELESKGVLRHGWSLTMLARLQREALQIKVGEYPMSPSMSPKQILEKLLKGEMFKRRIEVPPGATLLEVAEAIGAIGLLSREVFLAGTKDRQMLRDANVKESFEGYLFPGLYYFSRPVTVRDIVWRMLEEGEKHWPTEFSLQADKLNLSRHEILTLASILQKETVRAEDQPMLSAVFHSRLAKGMKLQSDATALYGIPESEPISVEEARLSQHVFNTHANYGLPPGPICSPGEEAIRAALYPTDSKNLFYVRREDGTLVFVETFQEYQQAIDKYIRGVVLPDAAMVPEASPSPTPTSTSRAIFTLGPERKR